MNPNAVPVSRSQCGQVPFSHGQTKLAAAAADLAASDHQTSRFLRCFFAFVTVRNFILFLFAFLSISNFFFFLNLPAAPFALVASTLLQLACDGSQAPADDAVKHVGFS